MKRKLFLLLFLAVAAISNGQNLVINPGFENYTSLPCDFDTTSMQFETLMSNWTVPNFTTPDICSPLIPPSCNYGNPNSPGSAGSQTPHSGNIMIGMACQISGYNEYLQIPLTTPLLIGNSYQASMYVSLAARSDFASNGIGMYFSDTLILDSLFDNTNYSPQLLDTTVISDTLNWTLISGCFTSTSPANYLIIGNFISPCFNGAFLGGGWPMSYYFFDDISVTQIPSCNSGQLNCTVGIHENQNVYLLIYPNPVSDFLTIENGENNAQIDITNIVGASILKCNIKSENSKINLNVLADGVYFLRYSESKYNKSIKIIKQ